MISDGIENCLHYIHNFNPDKSTNPFAYFTQIIYYAFIRRIQKEKKQLYIKYKTMQNIEQSIVLDDGPGNNVNDYRSSDFKIVVDDFVDNFEKSKKKKIIKKSESNLELFMSATI
jgi:DNA-directed RNA polymerase specialized sigma24 family protein